MESYIHEKDFVAFHGINILDFDALQCLLSIICTAMKQTMDLMPPLHCSR